MESERTETSSKNPRSIMNNNDGDLNLNQDSQENNGEVDVTIESKVERRNHINVKYRMADGCGWWCWKPKFCNFFRTPKWILAILSAGFVLQSVTANGLLPACVSSLERQFHLTSVQIGLIVSSFDIAMVLLVVPITYYGGRGNKPVWLGAGFVMLGTGALVFSLPHFLAPLYRPRGDRLGNQTELCEPTQSDVINSTCHPNTLFASKKDDSFFYVFVFAQILQGVGAAPMFSLGVPYMDESLDPKDSPLYVGVLLSMSLLGTALGFGAGGQLLNIYTDFDKIDASLLETRPGDLTWVGAWWPLFIICGALSIIVGILFMGFPKQMPGAQRFRQQRNSQQHQNSRFVNSQKSYLRHFLPILTNPFFMCLVVVAACEGIIIVGYGSFLAKYIEFEFKLTTAFAGVYTGICLVLGGGIGMVSGGYLAKRLNLTCVRSIKFSIIMAFIWFLPVMPFLYHCPRDQIAGVTRPYQRSNHSFIVRPSVVSSCNHGCNCETHYSPVCDVIGNVEYFSACHAGCTTKNLSKCACVERVADTDDEVMVTTGRCHVDCGIFLPLFVLSVMTAVTCTFVVLTPQITAAMRSVPEKLRPLGLGLMSLFGRLIGSIPAPIVFGAMIDHTCDIWEKETFCDNSTQRGSCLIYDFQKTGLYMLLGGFVPKSIAIFFLTLAGLLYRPPASGKDVTAVVATDVTELETLGSILTLRDVNLT